MNFVFRCSAATLICVGLLALAALMDGPEDHAAEWGESQNLQELQASEARTARREAAAQALCLEARGPQSEARWLANGSLVCTTRRGVVAANGGAL